MFGLRNQVSQWCHIPGLESEAQLTAEHELGIRTPRPTQVTIHLLLLLFSLHPYLLEHRQFQSVQIDKNGSPKTASVSVLGYQYV